MAPAKYEYAVIGGGFYGICVALYLREKFPKAEIALIERSEKLMSRASYVNQARVHNGYHYPRSFITAFRSRINLPRFLSDFDFSVKKDFTKLYCISKRNSKVSTSQFIRFTKEIGAKLERAKSEYQHLFNKNLIDEVFQVEEYAFDSSRICEWANVELKKKNIHTFFKTEVTQLEKKNDVFLISDNIQAEKVFNSTYSGLHLLRSKLAHSDIRLKHEITEMALIELPPKLEGIGITVMDGPFFSIMPFPARNLSTLSHVRFTPHCNWIDDGSQNPYDVLANYPKNSRFDRMYKDALRMLPALEGALYKDSLFEVKTVLMNNENDDGRPILFESYSNVPNFYSILGGKIDNIYDILDRINNYLK